MVTNERVSDEQPFSEYLTLAPADLKSHLEGGCDSPHSELIGRVFWTGSVARLTEKGIVQAILAPVGTNLRPGLKRL